MQLVAAAAIGAFCVMEARSPLTGSPLLPKTKPELVQIHEPWPDLQPELETLRPERCYWIGKHKRWGYSTPLGKVHSAGLKVLESHGWRCCEPSELSRKGTVWPLLSFTSRNAADFPADAAGPGVPRYRQLPQSITCVLDDKVELFKSMCAAGVSGCMPETILSDISDDGLVDLVRCHPEWEAEPSRWFVKFKHGVRGNSVHPCEDLQTVREWITKQRSGESGRQGATLNGPPGFVIQRGVPPRLLADGRRFVLRAHVLLLRTHSADGLPWRGFVHEDVITLPYSKPHEEKWRNDKSLHVSQAGKAHPTPFLMSELDGPEAKLVPPQLREITRQVLVALRSEDSDPFPPGFGRMLFHSGSSPLVS